MVFTLPSHAAQGRWQIQAYQQWQEPALGVPGLSDEDYLKALNALRTARNNIRQEITQLISMDEELTQAMRVLMEEGRHALR